MPEPCRHRYADGPRLVAWLECETEWRINRGRLLNRHEVAIRRWREGGQASFAVIDDVLTRLRIPPSWLPDELFRPYDNGRRRQAA
jgi:hypothetical protein